MVRPLIAYKPIRWRQFLNWGILILEDTSWYQLDKKQNKQTNKNPAHSLDQNEDNTVKELTAEFSPKLSKTASSFAF